MCVSDLMAPNFNIYIFTKPHILPHCILQVLYLYYNAPLVSEHRVVTASHQ